MIDFQDLLVNRSIIHTINPKEDGQDSATVRPSNEVADINHTGLEVIRERLIAAAGKHSRAFELEIEKDDDESVFGIASNFPDMDNAQFIEGTVDIADILAENQKRTNIPGGYLLVMDCVDNSTNQPVAIIIKAEPHEALQFTNIEGHSQVTVLQKVFLSPSQKLFKIGIIYRKSDDESLEVNERYGCFLYDEQFRVESHPAEYFYRDFLGFSIGNNSKIQSMRFYSKTETFILKNLEGSEIKSNLLSALKNEFSVAQNPTIDPKGFGDNFFSTNEGIRGKYLNEVCGELPSAIVKDDALIKGKLKKRKMDFPRNINVIGPEDSFDKNVEVISDKEELKNLDINDLDYTIIKIKGQPYSNE